MKINRDQIIEKCIDVMAHAELDWEYTSDGGNGINASEAGEFAEDILGLIGVDYEDIMIKIKIRVEQLEKEFD